MNCERPLYMEERGGMSKELKWEIRERGNGLLRRRGDFGRAFWAAEKAPVSSKPPPKAPTAHWRYLKVANSTDAGKGRVPNESNQKEKTPKQKTPKERIPMGKIASERMPKGRMEKGRIPKEGRHYRKLKKIQKWGVVILRRRKEIRTGDRRSAEKSTPSRIGSTKANGHIMLETGGAPEIRRREK